MTHHVILGAGPAGVIAAETIRKHAPKDQITVIGDENEAPYSRMAIPYLLIRKVGEEGTHINDFLVYLKGEFFDAVYLQQNAFDRTDEASSAERQRRMFAAAERVIDADFAFSSKEDARRVFQELRLLFIDWNSREFMGVEFIRIEGEILLRLGAGVLRRS